MSGRCVAVCLQWNAEAVQVSALAWGEARAGREHLNVQRLRVFSVLLIFISIPSHLQILVIFLSLKIVASWVLTLLLFMLHVKAKGFALRDLKAAHTFKYFGNKVAHLEFKNLTLSCDTWKSYFISEVYHCALGFPCNYFALNVFYYFAVFTVFFWILPDN